VWGVKERLYERLVPRLARETLVGLVQSAAVVDGVVKGLKDPAWPTDPWQALERLVAQALMAFSPAGATAR